MIYTVCIWISSCPWCLAKSRIIQDNFFFSGNQNWFMDVILFCFICECLLSSNFGFDLGKNWIVLIWNCHFFPGKCWGYSPCPYFGSWFLGYCSEGITLKKVPLCLSPLHHVCLFQLEYRYNQGWKSNHLFCWGLVVVLHSSLHFQAVFPQSSVVLSPGL